MPIELKWLGWPLFAWVFSGLVLQWLPYDQGRELHYGLFENLVSAITPILTTRVHRDRRPDLQAATR